MNLLRTPLCVLLIRILITVPHHVSSFKTRNFMTGGNFRYRSAERKVFKKIKNYTNHVEDHHCIPKEWREHCLLQELNFDVHGGENLIIMPNKKGIKALNLNPDTLVHQGGHHKYNQYVKWNLDEIVNKPCIDEKKYTFWLFLHHLKSNMQYNDDNIPWK
jgi:hypothetical protein